jgi:hypothetical protein
VAPETQVVLSSIGWAASAPADAQGPAIAPRRPAATRAAYPDGSGTCPASVDCPRPETRQRRDDRRLLSCPVMLNQSQSRRYDQVDSRRVPMVLSESTAI